MSKICENFLKACALTPDKTAVVTPDRETYSYSELKRYSEALICGFERLGLKQGDVVLTSLENDLPFIMALLAAAEIGLVLAPISTRISESQYQRSIS